MQTCAPQSKTKEHAQAFYDLVLLQCDSYGCSEFVSVHGKAQLAGNGRFPCQELQRSPWALTSPPAGRLRGVPQPRCSAWKGHAIPCALRLAAKRHGDAASVNITLKEY
jgi:hypothetical protein